MLLNADIDMYTCIHMYVVDIADIADILDNNLLNLPLSSVLNYKLF